MNITKVTLGENRGREKEIEVKTSCDIFNFLLSGIHGEYVYVNYYFENGQKSTNNYTVRCWYNDEDTVIEDGKRCYNWEKSQLSNAEKIMGFLKKDNITCVTEKKEKPQPEYCCRVRLTMSVELTVGANSEEEVQEWLNNTTPNEAVEQAKKQGNYVSANYEEEIITPVRNDSDCDLYIGEDI